MSGQTTEKIDEVIENEVDNDESLYDDFEDSLSDDESNEVENVDHKAFESYRKENRDLKKEIKDLKKSLDDLKVNKKSDNEPDKSIEKGIFEKLDSLVTHQQNQINDEKKQSELKKIKEDFEIFMNDWHSDNKEYVNNEDKDLVAKDKSLRKSFVSINKLKISQQEKELLLAKAAYETFEKVQSEQKGNNTTQSADSKVVYTGDANIDFNLYFMNLVKDGKVQYNSSEDYKKQKEELRKAFNKKYYS